MFDADTAALLQSAPEMPGLNPSELPAILTRHYTILVSSRLAGVDSSTDDLDKGWSLERIADTYELLASLYVKPEFRRPSAFVAATAQQILARHQAKENSEFSKFANVDSNRVDPSLAAPLLFLAAEQYADANESVGAIKVEKKNQLYEATILSESISDLARGHLPSILKRANRWRRVRPFSSIDEMALASLLEVLVSGIEIFAANLLRTGVPEPAAGRFGSADEAFKRVLNLSATNNKSAKIDGEMVLAYAGPHHLASLLLATVKGIGEGSLLAVPPPSGSDAEVWEKWLRYRANKFPFVWPNHREAIGRGFHKAGVSSVVVLPTGAGKTTISSLKIAGTLARRKKVVFLAPTHALVEQLTEDLQHMFPKEILDSVVSSNFDLLMQDGVILKDIEVMTPEQCLAMISFAPEAFSDVGLLVFDECHLLSPESGKIRRALDGMLCVLGFNHIAPDADMLFLSAMLKNGNEFAQWLEELTGRDSVAVDLLWKPSRQARGVVIYDDGELNDIGNAATEVQREERKRKKKTSKTLRRSKKEPFGRRAKEKLIAQPLAIWGLQHNWLSEDSAMCVTTKVLQQPVPLNGSLIYDSLHLTPNANQVAVRLAVAAAESGLKTIVFVNRKSYAVNVASNISALLPQSVDATELEQERWEALKAELGDLKHSVIAGPAVAVPHNSAMLRLERDLSERMFRRDDGARVIVATPTLAQGLNLPAHLAILAGDKRMGENGGREELQAHEILNAAARAGRAGHLANGLVLLIPDPVISSSRQEQALSESVVEKLKSVLPEDDHCVTITDPLEIVLDRLMQGTQGNLDVLYTINRMAVIRELEDDRAADVIFDLRKSFGAYSARRNSEEKEFAEKIEYLKKVISEQKNGEIDESIAILASRSGISADILTTLKDRIRANTGSLPTSVNGWLSWTVQWLIDNEDARNCLLGEVVASILDVCGKRKGKRKDIEPADLTHVLEGIYAWTTGQPLCVIEDLLGGNPNAKASTKSICPKARKLVSTVIPRGISFILGLVSHVVKDVDPFEQQEDLDKQLVECLGTAVRKGFDSTEKLLFANDNPSILSRVQIHETWEKSGITTGNN